MSGKKHILMVTGDSGIAWGKQNIFYEMLREFSKYFATVHVITGSNNVGLPFIIHENVHIHPSNRTRIGRWDFWSHSDFVRKRAREINERFPLAAVISHVIPPFFPGTHGGMRASADLKIPHFAEVMHIPGYPKAHGSLEAWERWAMGRFLKRHNKDFDWVRIINEAELRPYLKGLGVPKKKLLYVPAFYLDFDTFKPRKIAKKQQFVYAGRFETNKNIFALLDAFRAVAADYPEVKLVMIGDGSLREKVERERSERVEILGWLPTLKDVAKVYNESLALVMPSLSEGGPRVTLEAMACETLVLSTPVGIMKSVIKDGKNCLQIEWSAKEIEEKMRWVLEHPREVKKICRAGRESVQMFEYHEALGNYAKTYLKLIK
ncbi:glycosyltransferase family 4 protein [Patescibacteria group bacterium]|nr:glycosyltransferase family 4 protein [Patescibacteria group bacterium]